MSSPPEAEPAPSGVAAVIVLAAGEGTRMRSTRAKVLHEIAGHTLLSHAIDAAAAAQADRLAVGGGGAPAPPGAAPPARAPPPPRRG